MPNVMAALPNIGGLFNATKFGWRPLLEYRNAAKTWNPLKFAGVLQTNETISAASRPSSPYCKDMWGRYCCLTSFFRQSMCLHCEDTARRSCVMVRRWRIFGDFLCPVFSASHVQHVSDLDLKFTLRPHHIWYTSNLRRLRLGEEEKEEERQKKPHGKNVMACPIP